MIKSSIVLKNYLPQLTSNFSLSSFFENSDEKDKKFEKLPKSGKHLIVFGSNLQNSLGINSKKSFSDKLLTLPNEIFQKTHHKKDNKKKPKKINFKKISAGHSHVLALSENGSVYSWGNNRNGQLGLGNTKENTQPQKIRRYFTKTPTKKSIKSLYLKKKQSKKRKIIDISCGDTHSALIDENGYLYTFGKGGNWLTRSCLGLGLGSVYKNVSFPTLVSIPFIKNLKKENIDKNSTLLDNLIEDQDLERIKLKMVSCGEKHTAVVSENGDLFTFGNGQWGRLGNSNVSRTRPKIVDFFKKNHGELGDVLKVSCGHNFTSVLTENGDIHFFGKNDHLQFGFESNSSLFAGSALDGSSIPVQNPLFKKNKIKFKNISSGESYSCAVTQQGDVFVWGKNYYSGPRELKELKTKYKFDDVVEISAGGSHLGLLSNDGRLVMFGNTTKGCLAKKPSILDSNMTFNPIGSDLINNGKVLNVSCGKDFTICNVDFEKV